MDVVVTALSVAREREFGTFDQLMVSPLRKNEILAGRCGLCSRSACSRHVTFYVLMARFVFDVPLHGSLWSLYASAGFYLVSLIGVGLFISSMSTAQQQAILGSFLFAAPDLAFRVRHADREHAALAAAADFGQPAALLVVMVRDAFLKGVPPGEMMRNALPLALIALVALTSAASYFATRPGNRAPS